MKQIKKEIYMVGFLFGIICDIIMIFIDPSEKRMFALLLLIITFFYIWKEYEMVLPYVIVCDIGYLIYIRELITKDIIVTTVVVFILGVLMLFHYRNRYVKFIKSEEKESTKDVLKGLEKTMDMSTKSSKELDYYISHMN